MDSFTKKKKNYARICRLGIYLIKKSVKPHEKASKCRKTEISVLLEFFFVQCVHERCDVLEKYVSARCAKKQQQGNAVFNV